MKMYVINEKRSRSMEMGVEALIRVEYLPAKETGIRTLIDLDPGERLQRALDRERMHERPKYAEMCRRFLSDEEDFRDEKIREAGLMNEDGTYVNGVENDDLEACIARVRELIRRSEADGSTEAYG